jgi:hypothetical protein
MKDSMTSLLVQTVAQPTKWRFLPKNLNQLAIFVIGLLLLQKIKLSQNSFIISCSTNLITKAETKFKMIKLIFENQILVIFVNS